MGWGGVGWCALLRPAGPGREPHGGGGPAGEWPRAARQARARRLPSSRPVATTSCAAPRRGATAATRRARGAGEAVRPFLRRAHGGEAATALSGARRASLAGRSTGRLGTVPPGSGAGATVPGAVAVAVWRRDRVRWAPLSRVILPNPGPARPPSRAFLVRRRPPARPSRPAVARANGGHLGQGTAVTHGPSV